MREFRLIRAWDTGRELAPEDFQHILIPFRAFDESRIYYELDAEEYHYTKAPSIYDIPERKRNIVYYTHPYKRKQRAMADEVYDNTQRNIDEGWFIGINKSRNWNYYWNPFYFDEESNLQYDCFMSHWHPWFEMEVRRAYETSLNNHRGVKPPPTQKMQYSDAPIQHAQAAKIINSKAAGRLLAVGGVYNGNVEGFRKTAEQLGGEAVPGYDQVLNEKTAGTAIAAASILLAKRPNAKLYEEMNSYLGKLRGETKFLDGLEIKQINYIKRDPVEAAALRREFNSSIRNSFLKDISGTPEAASKFNPTDLLRMSEGCVPGGWSVHHKLPLDDGGTNAFDNLLLIKNEPFHKVLTNMQSSVTRGMITGESKVTPWAVPTGSIYLLN
ncbi:HNH endonuclease [Citrobacter braakii]|uniref:HNH endonuclease signature motif containing protein n=1 Tax=Citrobacter braakii TaxID=57706 RepID=UPI0024336D84|nr:HNH endonuclease signature motif containing protein [Citrobacter braakii]WFV82840.1 HNH endonuclease [Citrobacter braakii]